MFAFARVAAPLAFGLLLLSAASVTAQEKQATKQPPEQSYVDEQLGIELTPPKDWDRGDLTRYSVPGALRAAWSPDGVTSITLFVQRSVEAVDAQKLLDASIKATEARGSEIKKQKVGKIAGAEAMSLLVVGDGTGAALIGTGPVRTAQHWIAFPRPAKEVLVLLLTTPETDLPANERIFNALFDSLKLGDPHPEKPANLDFERVAGSGGILDCWNRCGNPAESEKYKISGERENARGGKCCARVQRSTGVPPGADVFGGLMQSITPDTFRGKRVRLSGQLKTRDIVGEGVLWMRVDGTQSGQMLAFDNMSKRPVQGTTDWKKYEIVLDVSPDAASVHFGALLNGSGTLWVDDLQFEVVGKDTPTTDLLQPRDSDSPPQK